MLYSAGNTPDRSIPAGIRNPHPKREEEHPMKKRMITAITVMLLLTLLSAAAVHASAAIRSVEYEGRGKVDVDFSSKVNYKKVKVSVRDAKGKKIPAGIVDRDSDDLEFVLQSYKPGSRYTFTISGIRRRGEKAFGNVKGSIRIPKSKGAVPVRETDYDSEDREVEFAFSSGVEWKEKP